jgi:hypothetical protein
MKFRILKTADHEWTIQKLQKGGEPISRGRYVGQLTKPRWIDVGYHNRFKWAATALLDQLVGDELEKGKEYLAAIEAAEARVMEAVMQLETEPEGV